jgi:type II secretion system protein C
MTKFLTAILIVVIAISIYSLQSIKDEVNSELDYSIEHNEVAGKVVSTNRSIDDEPQSFNNTPKNVAKGPAIAPNSTDSIDGLPYKIQLLGLVYSKIESESYAQLEAQEIVGNFSIDDEINDSSVYIKRINKKSIVVEFESADYEIRLGRSNSLQEQQLLVEFDQMTAKEIGSRPRKIEHIVTLLPNLFNDGGKIIIPGQNPDLFNSARFKEGDVLLEVNGFNIDDEASFSELQKHVRTAQTLKFVVNRAGRRITLYLDIPSEALKL